MNKTNNKSVLIVDGSKFTEETFKTFKGKLPLTTMSQLFVTKNKKYPLGSTIAVRAFINGMISAVTKKGVLLCDENGSYCVYFGGLPTEERIKNFIDTYGRNPKEVLKDYYSFAEDDFWKLPENMEMLETAKKIEFK